VSQLRTMRVFEELNINSQLASELKYYQKFVEVQKKSKGTVNTATSNNNSKNSVSSDSSVTTFKVKKTEQPEQNIVLETAKAFGISYLALLTMAKINENKYKKLMEKGLDITKPIPDGKNVIVDFEQLENSLSHPKTLQFLHSGSKIVEKVNNEVIGKGNFSVSSDLHTTPNDFCVDTKFSVSKQSELPLEVKYGFHKTAIEKLIPDEQELAFSINVGNLNELYALFKISENPENNPTLFVKSINDFISKNQKIHDLILRNKYNNIMLQDVSPLFFVLTRETLMQLISLIKSRDSIAVDRFIQINMDRYKENYNVSFVPLLHSVQGDNAVETGMLTFTKYNPDQIIFAPDHAGSQNISEDDRVMYCLNGTSFYIDKENKQIICNAYGTSFGSPESRMSTYQNIIEILSQYTEDYKIILVGDMNTYGISVNTINGHRFQNNAKGRVGLQLLFSRSTIFTHNHQENKAKQEYAERKNSIVRFISPQSHTFKTPIPIIGRVLDLRLDAGITSGYRFQSSSVTNLGKEFDHNHFG
jgi:hypothetical protein